MSTTTDDDPLDLIAELLHCGWRYYHEAFDREADPKKHPQKICGPRGIDDRLHPHIINWSEKEPLGRNQDRYQAALILNAWTKGEVTDAQALHRIIHNGALQWMHFTKRAEGHPHNMSFDDAHATDVMEHKVQAEFVFAALQKRNIPVPPAFTWKLPS